MRLKHLLCLTTLLVLIACSDNFSPTSPSTNEYSGTNSPPKNDPILSNWSPYLLIQATAEGHDLYREAFSVLSKKGLLKGIRMGIDNIGAAKDITAMAVQNNLDILGLISTNTTLNPNFNPDIEGTLANIYLAFPEINTFQIGNEVTIGPASPTGPGGVNHVSITLEQYIATWKRVWTFTRKNYPEKILVTQSTHSAADLEKMIDMGLLGVEGANRNNLIISMNCYSLDVAGFYGDVVRSRANGFRIWVTESGYPDWNMHKYHVEKNYPVIKTQIRAERIYWYALFAGRDDAFSLVKEPKIFPLRGSPLYEHLMGRGGSQ